MFIKTKNIKGNDYFYLMESQRVEGKSHPIPKTLAYLGNRDAALATLSDSDYPGKDQLLARVRAATPAMGKNQGKRGRPRKTASQEGDHPPPLKSDTPNNQLIPPAPDLSTIHCCLLSERDENFPRTRTVQEFAADSKFFKENIDMWLQKWLSEFPDSDPKTPAFKNFCNKLRFYAEKSCFWEEQIPKVEDMLRQEGAEELLPVFQAAPAFYVWDLLHNRPDSLLDYLWSLKQAIDESKRKLGVLQIEILLFIYFLTNGALMSAEWIPSKRLAFQPPSDRSAVSRALKILEKRGLIVRQSKNKSNTPKRTTEVTFTYLGVVVTKPIWDRSNATKILKFRLWWSLVKQTKV